MLLRLILSATGLGAALLAQGTGADKVDHPARNAGATRAELDRLTSSVSPSIGGRVQPNGAIARRNYIDEFIFGKMERDRVPHAPPSSDEEFLRRVSIDLIGRIPEPKQIRDFLANKDPNKRDRLIDELTDAKVDPAAIPHPSHPFLDRWTYFYGDLFRNAAAEIGVKGRNLLWDYIHTALLLDIPYTDFATELITASARSNWQSGAAGFLARNHADDADGLAINHEDTAEDIAISTTKIFLGVNLECVACHDGAHHLEKINLYLSRRKRDEFWRHSSFFGGVKIWRAFGIGQEFAVLDGPHRYDLKYPSVKRVSRYKEDTTPTFLLTGSRANEGENPRQAYARMLTASPQFSRAAVNLIWSELMGTGIVDPPFEFDLDRQDPAHPPPAPWTIQPTHPELLDALAKDFAAHSYSLRYLMRTITKSSAYQLSSRMDGPWKPEYSAYGARHLVHRLPAEQLYDHISQATGVFVDIPVAGTGEKVKYVLQTRCPADLFGKEAEGIRGFLADFGQSNRDQGEKSTAGSMVQASVLLNSKLVKDRVSAGQGRLKDLLRGENYVSNAEVVDELFLAALGRFPSEREKKLGTAQLEQYRERGAEDLLWALLNRTEFLFQH